jgi:hypothetical protein
LLASLRCISNIGLAEPVCATIDSAWAMSSFSQGQVLCKRLFDKSVEYGVLKYRPPLRRIDGVATQSGMAGIGPFHLGRPWGSLIIRADFTPANCQKTSNA